MKKIVLIGLFILLILLVGCNSDKNGINYEIEKNDIYGNMLLKLNDGFVDSVMKSLNYTEMKNIVKLHQYYIYDKNKDKSNGNINDDEGKYYTFDRDFTSGSLKQFILDDCYDAPIKVKMRSSRTSVSLAQYMYPRSSCLFHKKISKIFLNRENCFFEMGLNLTSDETFYSKRLMFLCQTQNAVYDRDINYCNTLDKEGKENTAQECYFELGQIYTDDSVCDMLNDSLENSKVRCYGFLGANLKDESVCDNLEKARDKGDCRGIIRGLK